MLESLPSWGVLCRREIVAEGAWQEHSGAHRCVRVADTPVLLQK